MKEVRLIVFEPEELQLAVAEYQQRSAAWNSPSAQLCAEDLLLAAIEFCITQKVPLPIRSSKRIEFMERAVALVITTAAECGRNTSSLAPPKCGRTDANGLGRPRLKGL